MSHQNWAVRQSEAAESEWIEAILDHHWGGRFAVVNEQRIDLLEHPALVAGDRQGLAIYRVVPRAELLLLHAEHAGAGIGTALIGCVQQICFAAGAPQLWVTTTNDNVHALAFYQRRGFHIANVRVGAVDRARALKPQIPTVGNAGIRIHDEVELVIKREGANRRPP
ncbi:MAG TPA: GNAT family N-acetyltransferase [Candidatus Tumulicola sp.]|jgi:GNAT superfamily N-acetyltransferase